MNDKELDLMISKIANELLQNSEEIDLIKILKSYETADWENWLRDIINLGIAYPISNLAADGDIIIDIVDFLRRNVISSHNYEKAVSNLLIKVYHQNPENILLLERLIAALISLSGYSSNTTLISILVSRINSHKKGNTSYIKTLALLALSKSAFLPDESKLEIYNYIILQGNHDMQHDPYFYSTALRFCYLQISVKAFFETLTLILIEIEKINDINVKDYIKHLMIDKIEELHFAKLPVFYNYFFHWLITTQDPKHSSHLNSNLLSKEILNEVGELIKNNSLAFPDIYPVELEATRYKNAVEFILSFTIEKDISISQIFNKPEELIKVLQFIASNTNYKYNLFNILKLKISYINNTKMRLIPELISAKYKSNNVIKEVIDIINDTIHSNKSDIKSSKKSILLFLN